MAGALDRLVPRVKTIIDRLGMTVTFKVPSAESFNDVTLEVERTTSNVSAVVTPPESYRSELVTGDMIRAGDAKFYLPASDLTFTPEEGMVVVIDSDTWKIVAVTEHRTGELIALYECQVRK